MNETTHEGLPNSERLPSSYGRHRGRLLVILLLMVSGMFWFAYANADFFVMICQRAGIITTPPSQLQGTLDGQTPGRPLDIYFSANVNDGLPIAFSVVNRYQKVRQGVTETNDYRFTNMSDRTLYFRPVHDVNPVDAGTADSMVLTKCFCFNMQKLEPHQTYSLPVQYTFTDKLPNDIRTIRMNYSLFPATKEAYDEWQKTAEQNPDQKLPGDGSDFLNKSLDKDK